MNVKIDKQEKVNLTQKMLTIALEVFPLSDKQLTGIGYTTKHIVEHLQKTDKQNKYILLFKDKNRHLNIHTPDWNSLSLGFSSLWEKKSLFYSKFKSKKSIQNIVLYILFFAICKSMYLLYNIYLSIYLKKAKVDIYIGFSHNYLPPVFFGKKIRKGLFLYDMVWKLYPETMEQLNKIKTAFTQQYNINRTDFLISISSSTKKDFLNYFNNYKKDIYTIHLAANKEIFKPQPEEKIKSIKRVRP